MTSIQYFKSMELYRVWEYNEKTNTIRVRYMTLDEVVVFLSTEEGND